MAVTTESRARDYGLRSGAGWVMATAFAITAAALAIIPLAKHRHDIHDAAVTGTLVALAGAAGKPGRVTMSQGGAGAYVCTYVGNGRSIEARGRSPASACASLAGKVLGIAW